MSSKWDVGICCGYANVNQSKNLSIKLDLLSEMSKKNIIDLMSKWIYKC